jgi:hypothetical protein
MRRGDRQTKFNDVAELDEGGLQKVVVPLPAIDWDLMAGQKITTGRLLYLEADVETLVKLDAAGDTGVKVKPMVAADAATKPGILYLEGEFTHVYVTPTGSSGNATLVFGIAGA